NTIIIAGISTGIFNANHLLRVDGYYILAELIQIPNLRQRADPYIRYLSARYGFGREEAQVPHATPGERAWFVGYSVTSFLYRIFVVVAILMFLTAQFFVLGMFFALLTGFTWFVLPSGKGLRYLFTSPRIHRVRGR